MDIWNKLRNIREDRGITQKEMAKSLGLDRKSIYHYESGKRKVPWEVVRGYGEKLGYEIRILIKE